MKIKINTLPPPQSASSLLSLLANCSGPNSSRYTPLLYFLCINKSYWLHLRNISRIQLSLTTWPAVPLVHPRELALASQLFSLLHSCTLQSTLHRAGRGSLESRPYLTKPQLSSSLSLAPGPLIQFQPHCLFRTPFSTLHLFSLSTDILSGCSLTLFKCLLKSHILRALLNHLHLSLPFFLYFSSQYLSLPTYNDFVYFPPFFAGM